MSDFVRLFLSETIQIVKSLDQDAIERLAQGLASVYESLSGDGELAGFEVTDRYFEVGSPKGLHDLETWLRDRAAAVPPN